MCAAQRAQGEDKAAERPPHDAFNGISSFSAG